MPPYDGSPPCPSSSMSVLQLRSAFDHTDDQTIGQSDAKRRCETGEEDKAAHLNLSRAATAAAELETKSTGNSPVDANNPTTPPFGPKTPAHNIPDKHVGTADAHEHADAHGPKRPVPSLRIGADRGQGSRRTASAIQVLVALAYIYIFATVYIAGRRGGGGHTVKAASPVTTLDKAKLVAHDISREAVSLATDIWELKPEGGPSQTASKVAKIVAQRLNEKFWVEQKPSTQAKRRQTVHARTAEGLSQSSRADRRTDPSADSTVPSENATRSGLCHGSALSHETPRVPSHGSSNTHSLRDQHTIDMSMRSTGPSHNSPQSDKRGAVPSAPASNAGAVSFGNSTVQATKAEMWDGAALGECRGGSWADTWRCMMRVPELSCPIERFRIAGLEASAGVGEPLDDMPFV